MAEAKDVRNLYQKLLAITEEIGKVAKTGKNTQQGYLFIEQAQIVAEVRVQLAKHGVVIIPETVSRTIEEGQTKGGSAQWHVNVISRYTLVNADDPSDKMVCEWDGGEALDTSDKGTNKAITASNKYFLMKLFNISDKDDPDSDSPEAAPSTARKPANVSKETLAKIMGGLKLKGFTDREEAANVMRNMAKTTFPVEEANDMTEEQGLELYKRLSAPATTKEVLEMLVEGD